MATPADTSEFDGGLQVSPRFAELAKRPGFLRNFSGGHEMRTLYRKQWETFNVLRLPISAAMCVDGALEEMKELIEYGPTINFAETFTPYKLSYATLIIYGAQRVTNPIRQKHHGLLKYLISNFNLPLDIPDIAGLAALEHCFSTASRIGVIPLARTLLESGANINQQNRYGEVPLWSAMLHGNVEGVELLMEFGARVDIPEAEGVPPSALYANFGPGVAAAMDKWMRKRRGEEEAPRTGKKCDWPNCLTPPSDDIKLKNCARCKIARYCGAECQKKHWPTHKKTCKALSESAVLTFVPRYEVGDKKVNVIPNEYARVAMGVRHDLPPSSHFRAARFTAPSDDLIIKIQVPVGGNGLDSHMLVYDKKRSFICTLWKMDNMVSYPIMEKLIKEKGPGGLKGYFRAEVVEKDKLLVRVEEMLAPQPF
ncbi:hypothetical protein BDN72DRAFT_800035 [Pluteus cervinus]|uniref:Uncharacterized protein n=1 Tax=Pluteus cervinus TaxID=181527 RepID=A0ACD3AL21_9AGAR|nr:hypothetical protein BDN72DRAFT_800035 [Pluteus cervinus]